MTTPDFSFLHDERFSSIITRDYEELQRLNPASATKSVIVLAGGVMEGLLFDALVASTSNKWTFTHACNQDLKSMIVAAKHIGIIVEDRLSEVVRNSRNLVHPGREVRDNVVFEVLDADLAKIAVDIVIREVREWSIQNKKRIEIEDLLERLDEDEKFILLLFGKARPDDPNEWEHPWLEHHLVYRVIPRLVEHCLIKSEKREIDRVTKDVITLVPSIIQHVENKLLVHKINRNSIVLNYKNIAPGNTEGGGATGSS